MAPGPSFRATDRAARPVPPARRARGPPLGADVESVYASRVVSTPTPTGPKHEPQLPRDGLEPEECEHLVRDDDPDTALCGVDQVGVPWNQGFPICQACLDVFQTELADLARVEIARRFADRHPVIGESTDVATFACPSRSLGDVVVWVEGEGVIVGVVDMWHGHFDEDTPEEMVAKCADFLDDLFHDKIVIWVARQGGRALGGGSFSLDVPAPPSGRIDRRMSRKADELRAATWSAPWVGEDGVDEEAEIALAELGRIEIARRFADQRPEIGEGARVATFTSPSIGDVVIEAQGACLVMEVVRMRFFLTFPFEKGTPDEIVAECAGFLDELFHDKIVFYRADDGRRGAGFLYRDADALERLRRLSQETVDLRAGTWSTPWDNDGILANG